MSCESGQRKPSVRRARAPSPRLPPPCLPFLPPSQSWQTTRAYSRRTDLPVLFLGVAICPFSTAAAIRRGGGRRERGSSLGSCFVLSSRVLVVRLNVDGEMTDREAWVVGREGKEKGLGWGSVLAEARGREGRAQRGPLPFSSDASKTYSRQNFKISLDRVCLTSQARNKGRRER